MEEVPRPSIGHFDFFVLRTPLLPFDEFTAWSDGLEAPRAAPGHLAAALARDLVALRTHLRAWLQRPVVQEALALASPSLWSGLPAWEHDPETARGRRVE